MSTEGPTDDTATDDLATATWGLLRDLVLERYDRRPDVAQALGMSFVRVKALIRAARGPLAMRALAAELQIDAPYLTLVVDDLEQRGLLERTVHPDDRRARVVTATPAGVQAAAQAQRLLRDPPAAIQVLTAPDLADLYRIVSLLDHASGGVERPGTETR
jgi:DNA-binding MarR family transcriptional regulator